MSTLSLLGQTFMLFLLPFWVRDAFQLCTICNRYSFSALTRS